jgi:hypothetical protein
VHEEQIHERAEAAPCTDGTCDMTDALGVVLFFGIIDGRLSACKHHSWHQRKKAKKFHSERSQASSKHGWTSRMPDGEEKSSLAFIYGHI